MRAGLGMAAAERENLESEEESEEQGGAAAQAAPEPSSETFVLENEDHTLANALRFFLNQKCACSERVLAGLQRPR